jgi:hypothetical protein
MWAIIYILQSAELYLSRPSYLELILSTVSDVCDRHQNPMTEVQHEKAVLVEDGQLRDHAYGAAQDLLRDRPRGAYTALTLLQGTQVTSCNPHGSVFTYTA